MPELSLGLLQVDVVLEAVAPSNRQYGLPRVQLPRMQIRYARHPCSIQSPQPPANESIGTQAEVPPATEWDVSTEDSERRGRELGKGTPVGVAQNPWASRRIRNASVRAPRR